MCFFINVARLCSLLQHLIRSDVALNCLYECFVSRLIIDSDSLTITDVTENDAGVYTCIMNTTLDHDSASAELNVVGKFSFGGAQFHRLVKQTLK